MLTTVSVVNQSDAFDWAILLEVTPQLPLCCFVTDPSHEERFEGIPLQCHTNVRNQANIFDAQPSYTLRTIRSGELTVAVGSFAGSQSFKPSFTCCCACGSYHPCLVGSSCRELAMRGVTDGYGNRLTRSVLSFDFRDRLHIKASELASGVWNVFTAVIMALEFEQHSGAPLVD